MKVAAARAGKLVAARIAADGLVTKNTADIKAAKAALAKAVSECKTAEYLRA